MNKQSLKRRIASFQDETDFEMELPETEQPRVISRKPSGKKVIDRAAINQRLSEQRQNDASFIKATNSFTITKKITF